ncbi:MAG: site-specific integrase [Nitrospirae bacterium]|nr:site-specific integrase [Nitrospirota bacterium]
MNIKEAVELFAGLKKVEDVLGPYRIGLKISKPLTERFQEQPVAFSSSALEGKESEVAFMPEHIAQKLAEYITANNLLPDDRVFRVCYTTVRNLVHRIVVKLNVKVSPHDLRRHSATYASRNGVPLEIISKVILRHQDVKTTQLYLGKVSDSEAIRWMDMLNGK